MKDKFAQQSPKYFWIRDLDNDGDIELCELFRNIGDAYRVYLSEIYPIENTKIFILKFQTGTNSTLPIERIYLDQIQDILINEDHEYKNKLKDLKRSSVEIPKIPVNISEKKSKECAIWRNAEAEKARKSKLKEKGIKRI